MPRSFPTAAGGSPPCRSQSFHHNQLLQRPRETPPRAPGRPNLAEPDPRPWVAAVLPPQPGRTTRVPAPLSEGAGCRTGSRAGPCSGSSGCWAAGRESGVPTLPRMPTPWARPPSHLLPLASPLLRPQRPGSPGQRVRAGAGHSCRLQSPWWAGPAAPQPRASGRSRGGARRRERGSGTACVPAQPGWRRRREQKLRGSRAEGAGPRGGAGRRWRWRWRGAGCRRWHSAPRRLISMSAVWPPLLRPARPAPAGEGRTAALLPGRLAPLREAGPAGCIGEVNPC